MAASHFTTMPCEAYKAQRKPNFYNICPYTKARASVGAVKSADRFVGFHFLKMVFYFYPPLREECVKPSRSPSVPVI